MNRDIYSMIGQYLIAAEDLISTSKVCTEANAALQGESYANLISELSDIKYIEDVTVQKFLTKFRENPRSISNYEFGSFRFYMRLNYITLNNDIVNHFGKMESRTPNEYVFEGYRLCAYERDRDSFFYRYAPKLIHLY